MSIPKIYKQKELQDNDNINYKYNKIINKNKMIKQTITSLSKKRIAMETAVENENMREIRRIMNALNKLLNANNSQKIHSFFEMSKQKTALNILTKATETSTYRKFLMDTLTKNPKDSPEQKLIKRQLNNYMFNLRNTFSFLNELCDYEEGQKYVTQLFSSHHQDLRFTRFLSQIIQLVKSQTDTHSYVTFFSTLLKIPDISTIIYWQLIQMTDELTGLPTSIRKSENNESVFSFLLLLKEVFNNDSDMNMTLNGMLDTEENERRDLITLYTEKLFEEDCPLRHKETILEIAIMIARNEETSLILSPWTSDIITYCLRALAGNERHKLKALALKFIMTKNSKKTILRIESLMIQTLELYLKSKSDPNNEGGLGLTRDEIPLFIEQVISGLFDCLSDDYVSGNIKKTLATLTQVPYDNATFRMIALNHTRNLIKIQSNEDLRDELLKKLFNSIDFNDVQRGPITALFLLFNHYVRESCFPQKKGETNISELVEIKVE